MMVSDIPKFTDHEVRALIYIYETENQLKPEPTISELKDFTDWDSKYYTRAWKRLEPRNLVNRESEGRSTKLSLTDKGRAVAVKLMEINEILDQ